jgi:hypothetical protein
MLFIDIYKKVLCTRINIKRVKSDERLKESLLWSRYYMYNHICMYKSFSCGWRRLGLLIKATIAFTRRSFNESEIILESDVGEILTEVDEDTSRNYTEIYTVGTIERLKSWRPSDNFGIANCARTCKADDRYIEKKYSVVQL